MASIALDTGHLADFLGQFYGPAQRGSEPFRRGDCLTEEAARAINVIVRASNQEEPARYLVFASALAFVEIARKWDEIVAGRFQPHQLRAFVASPPPWFAVDPVDESLVEFFLQVPITVALGGHLENVEWADAIHVATALSHDTGRVKCLLGAKDRRVKQIPQLAGRCL
jgi:hypothetical protein